MGNSPNSTNTYTMIKKYIPSYIYILSVQEVLAHVIYSKLLNKSGQDIDISGVNSSLTFSREIDIIQKTDKEI